MKFPSTAVLTDPFGATKVCPRGRIDGRVSRGLTLGSRSEDKDVEEVSHGKLIMDCINRS